MEELKRIEAEEAERKRFLEEKLEERRQIKLVCKIARLNTPLKTSTNNHV
jgi:hypothetical protein